LSIQQGSGGYATTTVDVGHVDRPLCVLSGRPQLLQRKIEQREGISMLSGMTRIRRQKTSSVPGSRNGFRFVDLTT
jgi:hypothetical protein